MKLNTVTTRELLREIIRRGIEEQYYVELGIEMTTGAENLLERLPGSMLDNLGRQDRAD